MEIWTMDVPSMTNFLLSPSLGSAFNSPSVFHLVAAVTAKGTISWWWWQWHGFKFNFNFATMMCAIDASRSSGSIPGRVFGIGRLVVELSPLFHPECITSSCILLGSVDAASSCGLNAGHHS
eukprot:scaffold391387_cov98-Attheya_sp.AAC.1